PCRRDRWRLYAAGAARTRLCRVGHRGGGRTHLRGRQDRGLSLHRSAQPIFKSLLCQDRIQAGMSLLALSESPHRGLTRTAQHPRYAAANPTDLDPADHPLSPRMRFFWPAIGGPIADRDGHPPPTGEPPSPRWAAVRVSIRLLMRSAGHAEFALEH